jgi:SprT protein
MEEQSKVSLLDAVERAKARLYRNSSKRSSNDDQQIREWVRYACECNGVPELSPIIKVEWNTRFTRRMGDGMFSPSKMMGRIRLSVPLWGRASEQDRRESVIHEACHVIVFYNDRNAASHGAEWREAMKRCGVDPQRTHTVDRTGLVRRKRLFVLCNCPKDEKCRIGIRTFNLVRRGAEFQCNVCGLDITQASAIEKEETAVRKM